MRVLLMLQEKERFVTELLRGQFNPRGIVSQDALRRCRQNLRRLGLIVEEREEGPRPKVYLRLTEKGRRVAEKIREILAILEQA